MLAEAGIALGRWGFFTIQSQHPSYFLSKLSADEDVKFVYILLIDTSLIHPLEVAPSLQLFAFTHPRPAMPRSQNFMQIPREARPLCLCNRFVVMISIVICDWICFIGCHARVKEVMPLFTKGTVFPMQFPCVEASPYPTTRCTSTTTLVYIYVLKGLRQLWSCPRLPVNEKMLWSFAINFEMIMN